MWRHGAAFTDTHNHFKHGTQGESLVCISGSLGRLMFDVLHLQLADKYKST